MYLNVKVNLTCIPEMPRLKNCRMCEISRGSWGMFPWGNVENLTPRMGDSLHF